MDLVDPFGRRALGAPEPDRAHAERLAQPGHLAPDLAQADQEQGLPGQLPEGLADLGPGSGPLVLDEPWQVLGHGQQPEDGELGQRDRVDAAGGGDGDPFQGLGRQAGLPHLLAGPGAGGVDPAQPGSPVTTSARSSAESPGTPNSTSARSSSARQRASPSASRRNAGSPRWSAG